MRPLRSASMARSRCARAWDPSSRQASSLLPCVLDGSRRAGRLQRRRSKMPRRPTVERVVNTWLELRSFLESRGRPAPPEVVDLDQFLQHTSYSAPAPARDGSEQLASAGHAQGDCASWPGSGCRGPTHKALEDRIVELHAVGDERRTVLLASVWVLALHQVGAKAIDRGLHALQEHVANIKFFATTLKNSPSGQWLIVTMYMTLKSGCRTRAKGVYPSREEAEYTATSAFAIAVSVSWWATRGGLAKLGPHASLHGSGKARALARLGSSSPSGMGHLGPDRSSARDQAVLMSWLLKTPCKTVQSMLEGAASTTDCPPVSGNHHGHQVATAKLAKVIQIYQPHQDLQSMGSFARIGLARR